MRGNENDHSRPRKVKDICKRPMFHEAQEEQAVMTTLQNESTFYLSLMRWLQAEV